MLNLRPSRSSQPSQPSQPSQRGAGELIDPAALSAELKVLAERHARARTRIAQRRRPAAQSRAHAGACARRGFIAQGPPWPALRRAARGHAGRDHSYPVRIRRQRALSVARAVRGRTHGGGCDRRLRPRPVGAGLRHRSSVSTALQTNGVGGIGRRGAALLLVGYGIEGRPRHALGR